MVLPTLRYGGDYSLIIVVNFILKNVYAMIPVSFQNDGVSVTYSGFKKICGCFLKDEWLKRQKFR